jgi:hypothetical protein
MLNININKRNYFILILSLVFFILPKIIHADVLLPGNINTCGELAISGTYTLTTDISNGASTCLTISSDNVTIVGNNHTISGTGDTAIDGRARTSGNLTEGAHGYTNLIINDLIITGYTAGINISGNSDTSGTGINNGYGGDGGDISIYYSKVGSVITQGGNSSSKSTGGQGGNIMFTDTDLDISNSTLTTTAGTGTTGRNTDGGLDLNYTGTITKTNLTLSSLSFFNDNDTQYGVYAGGGASHQYLCLIMWYSLCYYNHNLHLNSKRHLIFNLFCYFR